MATPDDAQTALSRTISELDLTRALDAARIQAETGMRYTAEQILEWRPKPEKISGETVVVEEVGSPLHEGVMTPPNLVCPKPPPPTPATYGKTATVKFDDVDEAPSVPDTTLAPLPNGEAPKKKRKKSSGKNRKPPATGFEGIYHF